MRHKYCTCKRQGSFAEALYQPADQPPLDNHAKNADARQNVAGVQRIKAEAMQKQKRKNRRHHREADDYEKIARNTPRVGPPLDVVKKVREERLISLGPSLPAGGILADRTSQKRSLPGRAPRR